MIDTNHRLLVIERESEGILSTDKAAGHLAEVHEQKEHPGDGKDPNKNLGKLFLFETVC